MDHAKITAELVGTSKAQRLRIAGRAVMRVLPLLAIRASEHPFDYWPVGKRAAYIHTLFRLLLPALTDRVKVNLTTSELAPILHASSRHTHLEHLLMAIRNVGRIVERNDYPAICEATMAAMQRCEDAADAAMQHYVVASDKYAALKEEKYSTVERVRYGSTYTTAYSASAVGTYSAIPSGSVASPAAGQLIKELEEILRRDILHIGARSLHDKPLPVGLPLWQQIPQPSMLVEVQARMEDWLVALGGDCPRWAQLYRAALNGRL